jgi:AcrR family transcriptional regulator
MSGPHTTVANELGDLETLPRGRHGIAPEQVIDHQRQRLLAATAAVFVEQGYASVSVEKVICRARVSRATFYKLFDDKLDCVLAAHLAAFRCLEEALRASCARQRPWAEGVSAAVSAGLEFAVRSPAEASLLAFAPVAAEPEVTSRALAANAHLLGLLRAGREDCPGAEAPGELAEQALLMGLLHVVGAELIAGRAEGLPGLAPELSQLLLMPFLGEAEAKLAATSP